MIRAVILVFTLTITIIAFIVFLIGAHKAQKNLILWGFLGAFSFLIPVLVLFPIALSLLRKIAEGETREATTPLFLSFIAIISAVGAFVASMVYRKYLTKVLTAEKNEFVFCSECGTQCRANAAFCGKCGNSIEQR